MYLMKCICSSFWSKCQTHMTFMSAYVTQLTCLNLIEKICTESGDQLGIVFYIETYVARYQHLS